MISEERAGRVKLLVEEAIYVLNSIYQVIILDGRISERYLSEKLEIAESSLRSVKEFIEEEEQ